MKCPKCGTTVKDDAKFCFACGAKLEQPKALAEPEKIEVQHVKMKPEAPKAKKKGNNKKVGKIVVAVGVCAAVVVVGVNIVPRLTQTDNPCVYLSDGSYNLLTKMKKDSGVDFADGVSTAVFENSPYTIKGRTQFSPSGKYLYFYNNYDGNGGTLCRIRWDKIKKNSSGSRDYENIETIGSNISDTYNIYRLISDDEVIYKDTSDSLYYYNGEETTKIAKQAADFWVDENGRIVYVQGEILFNTEDYLGARQIFEACIDKTEDSYVKMRAYIMTARCIDKMESGTTGTQEKIRLLEEAEQELSGDGNIGVLEELAQAYCDAGAEGDDTYYQKAIEIFKQIEKQGMSDYDTEYNLAVLYQNVGDYSNAAETLDNILKTYGEDYRTYKSLAYLEASKQNSLAVDLRNYSKFGEYYKKADELYQKESASNANDADMERLQELYQQAVDNGWL